jgi:hypothetical protein
MTDDTLLPFYPPAVGRRKLARCVLLRTFAAGGFMASADEGPRPPMIGLRLFESRGRSTPRRYAEPP